MWGKIWQVFGICEGDLKNKEPRFQSWTKLAKYTIYGKA